MENNDKNKLLKALDLIKAILLAIIAYFSATSCGLTKAVIKTNADNTASTITITTNNPTEVNASPNVDFQYKPRE